MSGDLLIFVCVGLGFSLMSLLFFWYTEAGITIGTLLFSVAVVIAWPIVLIALFVGLIVLVITEFSGKVVLRRKK